MKRCPLIKVSVLRKANSEDSIFIEHFQECIGEECVCFKKYNSGTLKCNYFEESVE